MRLFGKKKNVKIHTAQELNCISLSCNHMNYNYCYSFFAEKRNEVWLFSANSYVELQNKTVELKKKIIDNTYVEQMYKIIKENGLITYVENYKKPEQNSEIVLLDATEYYFGMGFNDGFSKTVGSFSVNDNLERFFFELVQQYCNKV
ncbi:hypothetical protein ACTQ3M_02240 [Oscillospiraceae bacterium LCP25S3_E10]